MKHQFGHMSMRDRLSGANGLRRKDAIFKAFNVGTKVGVPWCTPDGKQNTNRHRK